MRVLHGVPRSLGAPRALVCPAPGFPAPPLPLRHLREPARVAGGTAGTDTRRVLHSLPRALPSPAPGFPAPPLPLRHLSTCVQVEPDSAAGGTAGRAGNAVQVHLEFLGGEDAGIAVLSLDRPESRNAIGLVLLSQLLQHLHTLHAHAQDPRRRTEAQEQDEQEQEQGSSKEQQREQGEGQGPRGPSPRVLVVASKVPGIFSAGADLKERRGMSLLQAATFVDTLRNTFSFLEKFPLPTIAAVDGLALGGGLELALACDLRVCGGGAQLGLPETALAIIPGAGGTQRLPRIVGRSRAKELIFTGRRVEASEAKEIGLANQVAPPGQALSVAVELGRSMLPKGPLALRHAKYAIDRGLDLEMEAGLAVERGKYMEVLQTQDRVEGLQAFREKRVPMYRGV